MSEAGGFLARGFSFADTSYILSLATDLPCELKNVMLDGSVPQSPHLENGHNDLSS